jgi:solute carrier family 25 2-oxodicarboxylate transporter 21
MSSAPSPPPLLPSWVVPVLAGGGAGLVETVLTYPLDLIKTRQQASTAPISVWRTLTDVLREGSGGVMGLYRGITAPLLSEVPRRAFKFGFNARLQRLLKEDLGVTGLPAAVVAGAGAGASETLVHTPFERVKILSQSGQSRSPLAAARAVVASEGFFGGLYRGFLSYAMRQAVWNGAFFGFIFGGKYISREWSAMSSAPGDKGGGGAISPAANFVIGLMSGSLATCANNPLDVAKTRIQNATAADTTTTTTTTRSRSTVTVLNGILRQEGLNGLFKGLPARLYRSAPGHGILFMAYSELEGRIGRAMATSR